MCSLYCDVDSPHLMSIVLERLTFTPIHMQCFCNSIHNFISKEQCWIDSIEVSCLLFSYLKSQKLLCSKSPSYQPAYLWGRKKERKQKSFQYFVLLPTEIITPRKYICHKVRCTLRKAIEAVRSAASSCIYLKGREVRLCETPCYLFLLSSEIRGSHGCMGYSFPPTSVFRQRV